MNGLEAGEGSFFTGAFFNTNTNVYILFYAD